MTIHKAQGLHGPAAAWLKHVICLSSSNRVAASSQDRRIRRVNPLAKGDEPPCIFICLISGLILGDFLWHLGYHLQCNLIKKNHRSTWAPSTGPLFFAGLSQESFMMLYVFKNNSAVAAVLVGGWKNKRCLEPPASMTQHDVWRPQFP